MEALLESEHRDIEENTYQKYEHYRIEKALANQLRNSSADERKELYAKLYDEMYERVPLHPMLVSKLSPHKRIKDIEEEFSYLKKHLKKESTFIEVGAGDCGVSFKVADYVKQVYAIEVSEVITKSQAIPSNFKLLLTDGTNIPVNKSCANVVYSNQLMEHLHEDDAKKQLNNIYKALAPSGIYFCQTPNKLNGPHDISAGFDEEATCFHLKEYTTKELAHLFKEVGFSKLQVVIGAKGLLFTIPLQPIIALESVLGLLPHKVRTAIARTKLFQALLDIRMIGTK